MAGRKFGQKPRPALLDESARVLVNLRYEIHLLDHFSNLFELILGQGVVFAHGRLYAKWAPAEADALGERPDRYEFKGVAIALLQSQLLSLLDHRARPQACCEDR
jgi:hypothetical protein